MENLKVRELIEICEELGLTLGRAKRKQAILEIMKKEGVTAEEVDEAWADIKGRREEAERRELREREEAERRELREREREEAERQERLEMKRIELALRQCSQAPSVASATVPVSGHRIRDQLPPFVVGEDMAKYLVKFEHVCERNAIERSLWAQNLLALLPGEVSDVITCLSREAFESYDEVKEALLRRYKLSPEAFRQRFRYAKRGNESHVDFAFRLKADLVEWLKGEDVYDDRDKVVECIALEQFYRCIEDDVKLWLQDKLGEVQLNKAAELAEEYYTRRNLHSRAVRVEKFERKEGFPRKPDERKPFPNQPSTSLAAKDRQKRRAKLVDSSWRQAGEAGILPEEWDLFTERSQEPSVRRALEGSQLQPSLLRQNIQAGRTSDASGVNNSRLSDAIRGHSCGAPDAIDGNSSRTCAANPLTHGSDPGQQPTAVPDWRLQLADARDPKRGYKRSKPRSDGRERLKKSRVVIAPQCEPNKLSAPVPKM
ncbi:hypothetical protein HPB50_009316 [Hyalomma asiaticum]|uniref:Uncharacterized protein n=1 Tax=Hyalomma asiaticum TaxID=266040 RepID=A0ACB7T8U0_HYAAI|nr:hypothetical protein HPB50_009316 [Hyalomma asiaticum]